MQITPPSPFGATYQTDKTSKSENTGGSTWMDAAPTAASSTARTKFNDYVKMTPAEKMHAAMLARLGITEEQFKAMSPEEREKIEAKIKEMIKQEAENSADKEDKKGLFADVKV